MKRSELSVGLAVALKDRSQTGLVLDVAPWVEGRQYMGRFGTHGTGRFSPLPTDPHRRYGLSTQGVAVAVRRGDRWEPDVWMLGRMVTAEQRQAELDDAARLRAAREASSEQTDRKMRMLPDEARAQRTWTFDRRLESHRVSVSADWAVQAATDQRVLAELVSAGLVDEETLAEVQSGLEG